MEHVAAIYTVAAGVAPVDDEPLVAHDAIQFADNSSLLQPSATQFLDVLAAVLRANPPVTVDIRGYTDGVDDAGAKLTLSQHRVDAVAAYLTAQGVAAERLVARGFGASFPVAPDDTEAGRAKNRRVEFTLHHLLG
jgi:outer membrane protein OmpA-like peptidoglycan-associated protein